MLRMPFMRRLRRLLADRRAELDEAAIVLPVMLLVAVGLVNMALLGAAAVNAGNAANYGARMGAVAQENAADVAWAASNQAIQAAPIGEYAVQVSGGGAPGLQMTVSVSYRVPNYFAPLTAFFGVITSPEFSGASSAYFRQEGW